MSYIPDCRTDENYNIGKLNKRNLDFVSGYDYAVEIIETLFANTDVFPELERLLDDKSAVIMNGKAEVMQESVETWLEMARDEMIVSLIEEQE